ncbi:MAG: hypothetical protein BGN99_06930 [Alphaproteobacteria bacterium 65-37]|nr:MAG: hypothetical protein BGN99_06930 [Alphaproteobacteria bacterium 65-37]
MGAPPDLLAQTEPVQQAFGHLVKEGYVILDRVLPPATVAQLEIALEIALEAALVDLTGTPDDRFRIGTLRYALPIALSGPFADPIVYANPAVTAIARVALDRSVILQGFGAEMALPGGAPQHIDRDGRLLFDADLSPLLPAHALTCRLAVGAAHSVAIWPGSHRWKVRNEEAPPEVIDVPPGSVALFDSRLLSGATANRSDKPHYLLQAAYARRWFRDSTQGLRLAAARLEVGRDFLATVAPDDRGLFAHLRNAS